MTSDPQNLIALPPGTMVGKYRIVRFLAKGGFGLTYEAIDPRIGLKVAIKELLPDGIAARVSGQTVVPQTNAVADDFRWARERFEEEAKNLAELDHANVLRVLGIEDANGTVYMVMEYVEGRSLADLLKAEGPLPEERVREILAALASGLEHVHEKGLLHRDVKPGNVMLRSKNGHPVLLDFGSARQDLRNSLAMTTVVSHGYSPKEQYTPSSRSQGPWTDVYALAATGYAMCRGEDPRDVIGRDENPEAPGWVGREIGGRYSGALPELIERGMALRAVERPQTVGDWWGGSGGTVVVSGGGHGLTTRLSEAMETTAVKEPRGGKGGGMCGALALALVAGFVAAVCLLVVGLYFLWRALDTPDSDVAGGAAAGRSGEAPVDAPAVVVVPIAAPTEPEPPSMEGTRAGEVRTFGGIEMVWCPPGEFWMGSSEDEEGRDDDETRHLVTLTRGFWLAKTECTQRHWEEVMGGNPSEFKGADLPVETVSWDDVQSWLERMNGRNPLPSGWKWSLPTEAQWEYACRAGTETEYAGNLDEMAWYDRNSVSRTNSVGTKKANAWGFHDMHGNVFERCSDLRRDYEWRQVTDPVGSDPGNYRVVRGGSWNQNATRCRSASRPGGAPIVVRLSEFGFRPALVPPR